MAKRLREFVGGPTRTADDEGTSDPLADVRQELARLSGLGLIAFDDELAAAMLKKTEAVEHRQALEGEQRTLTEQLQRGLDQAVAGGAPLDHAARERDRTRLRVLEEELLIVASAVTRIDATAVPARERALHQQREAWRRLHALAIVRLDDALESAARANNALHAVQLAAGPNVLNPVTWGELIPNASGSGRLESWRRFIARECGEYVTLEERE